MTTLPETSEAKGSEIPVLDRVLAYGVCPVLLLANLFLLIKVGAAGKELPEAASHLFPLLWLLAISGMLLVICVGLSCWRISTFIIERRAAVRETGLQRRAHHFEEMSRLVVDSIPNILFISDRDGRIWFANRETVPKGKEMDDVLGKTLDRIFLPQEAQQMQERIRRAQKANAPVITMDRHETASGPSYMETYHIPLPNSSDLHDTVLVTQRDITGTIIERERQEQILKQIVDALIAVIDRRDPYAAGHSIRVGIVAANLARHLKLDEPSVEAVRIAGALMNLGKIMVPRRILVKTTALDAEELKLVRKSILASADILSLISFQAPVIPTLRQVLERYDGTGAPEGRKGENILVTARIVAVANAFIALVSPRAHRAGLSVDEALKILEADGEKAYDPRLVKALATHLKENPGMKETLVKPTPEIKGVITADVAV